MRTNHLSTPVAYALLVILTLWLISPAIAGNGDPDQASQAWPMIQNGALLIDVRTNEEFDAGHIEGATNIPYNNTSALIDAIGNDKQRLVVVYCRSGKRAGRAKSALDEKGYTNIFNATGYEALKATRP